MGIPTTRSLALLTADIQSIPVFRETGAEPPSLLARIAPSFIRIGHFEALNPGRAARNMRQIFFGGNWAEDESSDADEKGALGGQGNLEGLERLVRWCKDEVMGMREASVQDWVREVVKRNAEMVAGWQVRLMALSTCSAVGRADENRCMGGCTVCLIRTTFRF